MGHAEFSIALDGDRPTEIELKVIVSPVKNSRGRRGAKVAFECGKAKRRGKPDAEPKIQPAGRGPLSRRKANVKKHA